MKIIKLLSLFIALFTFYGNANCQSFACDVSNPTGTNFSPTAGKNYCFTVNTTFSDVTFNSDVNIYVAPGVTLNISGNVNSTDGKNIKFEIEGTVIFGQNPDVKSNLIVNIFNGGALTIGSNGSNNITLSGSRNEIINYGTFKAGGVNFNNSSSVNYVDNYGRIIIGGNFKTTTGATTIRNFDVITFGQCFDNGSHTTFINCGTINCASGFNLNGATIINTGLFNSTGGTAVNGNGGKIQNYGIMTLSSLNMSNNVVLFNEGLLKLGTLGLNDGKIEGPSTNTKKGYIRIIEIVSPNNVKIGPNLDFTKYTSFSPDAKSAGQGELEIFRQVPKYVNETGAAVLSSNAANVTYDCSNCVPMVTDLGVCPNRDGTFPKMPVATKDSVYACAGYSNITIDILSNDKIGTNASQATKDNVYVTLYDNNQKPANGNRLVVAGEGTWTYNSSTGLLSFSPDEIFTNIPSSILYSITEKSTVVTSKSVLVKVLKEKNFWMGSTDPLTGTKWNLASNWTCNTIPPYYEDVEFATEDNYGIAAVNDLYVPEDDEKKIGNLINLSEKGLVVSAGSSMIVTGSVAGFETNTNKLRILADANDGSNPLNPAKANGTFIVENGCGTTIKATVQMYAKSEKNNPAREWTDYIVGSPTSGQTFTNIVYQWQQFGIPVKQVQANPTFAGTYLNEYFENWNGDNKSFYQKWKNLNNSSTLNAFNGYELAQDSKKIISIEGELFLCDKTITLTREAPEITTYKGNVVENKRYGLGQNVFGNSFTAAIDVSAIDFDNIYYNGELVDNSDGSYLEKTVYVYNVGCFGSWGAGYYGAEPTSGKQCAPSNTNAGSYTTVPYNTAVATYDEIPSMQGFLLKHVKDEKIIGNEGYGHPITLKLPYKSLIKNDLPQKAPGASLSYLKVSLVSSSTRDLLWLFSQEGTSDDFDNGWDGEKFFGTPTAFIYSPTLAGNMQVNTTDNIVGSYIDFVANTEKTYTITFDKVNLDGLYPELYLVDLVTKEVVALNNETTSYTFTADNAGATSRRFRIKSEPFVSESDTYQIDAYDNGKGIVVMNNETENVSFKLYDSLGKLICTQNIQPMSQQTISVNVVSGVYIASFTLGANTTSKKIVVTK